MTASAINALIMGKRKLPSILRREVPPLHVTSDVRRLMGHSKVGKVIKHRGRPVIVLAVHENIRQVTDGRYWFWVPRRTANRKKMNDERIRREYINRTRSVFFAPHFTGEPRPYGIPVTLQTLTPTPNSSGALASTWGNRVPRRLLGQWSGLHLVPVAKDDPMKTQIFFSRTSVERALQKMRIDAVRKAALMEVVFSRQSPATVARTYAFPLPHLEVYASRLRKRIRDENPNAFAT